MVFIWRGVFCSIIITWLEYNSTNGRFGFSFQYDCIYNIANSITVFKYKWAGVTRQCRLAYSVSKRFATKHYWNISFQSFISGFKHNLYSLPPRNANKLLFLVESKSKTQTRFNQLCLRKTTWLGQHRSLVFVLWGRFLRVVSLR